MKRSRIYKPIARFTKYEYANSFLKGFLWINRLTVFQDYIPKSNSASSSLNNGQRDYLEGISSIEYSVKETPFAHLLSQPDDLFNSLSLIPEYINRCYCLSFFRMEYEIEKENIIVPDMRMQEFGDTVLIIKDPEQLYYRINDAVKKKYPKADVLLHDIIPYDENVSQNSLSIFYKRSKYSYQNELRLAIILPCEEGYYDETTYPDHLEISIGGLDDIIELLPTSSLFENPNCLSDYSISLTPSKIEKQLSEYAEELSQRQNDNTKSRYIINIEESSLDNIDSFENQMVYTLLKEVQKLRDASPYKDRLLE